MVQTVFLCQFQGLLFVQTRLSLLPGVATGELASCLERVAPPKQEN